MIMLIVLTNVIITPGNDAYKDLHIYIGGYWCGNVYVFTQQECTLHASLSVTRTCRYVHSRIFVCQSIYAYTKRANGACHSRSIIY